MRKVECQKSKHHGFHVEGQPCELCPAPEGLSWATATGEQILDDLQGMLAQEVDFSFDASDLDRLLIAEGAQGLYTEARASLPYGGTGCWVLSVRALDGQRRYRGVQGTNPELFRLAAANLAVECWHHRK